jgi:nitroreductase
MNLLEAIENRKSIRKFKPDPLSRVMLQEILQAALRAPSAINTQPWECWVVGGETLQQLSRELFAEGTKETPSRADFRLTEIWKDTYLNRMRENGKGLFGLLGIDRQDREKRKAFSLSMYKFFDAPQVIFLCLDSSLGDYSLFDCGCFALNICLLATSKGLGTCIQHSGVHYPDIIRKYVPIPAEKQILVAISIGYPDEQAVVNRFRSTRETLENVVHWEDLT